MVSFVLRRLRWHIGHKTESPADGAADQRRPDQNLQKPQDRLLVMTQIVAIETKS